jgi:ATP-dependent Clp protease, protease subunit
VTRTARVRAQPIGYLMSSLLHSIPSLVTPLRLDDKDDEKKDDKKEETFLSKEIAESFIKQRKLFLFSAVDDAQAEKLVKLFMYLDSVNHDDITFYINSPGGVISSGMAIYDAMQSVKSDVATVVCGQAASMGAQLLAGGTKGKRYSWKNSRVMIHQPLIQGHMYGPASDIKIQAEEMLRIRTMLNKLLADHTGKTEAQIERDTERDNFMTAEEAKAYGMVDIIENKL